MNKGASPGRVQVGTLETLFQAEEGTYLNGSTQAYVWVELQVDGLARFLSHADLMRMARRCFVRAGLDMLYSEGFNPHPRLSMPLPKPVGLLSDGDIVTVGIHVHRDIRSAVAVSERLSGHWPQGVTMKQVWLSDTRRTLYPHAVDYELPARTPPLRERLTRATAEVMAKEHLDIERIHPKHKHKTKHIDIRPFLSRMWMTDAGLVVTCSVRTSGSVRMDEILRLLGVQVDELEGPVKRTNIQWRCDP